MTGEAWAGDGDDQEPSPAQCFSPSSQCDMQKLTVDELKRLLYDTFRDHLTMKDIENIIMTEENHLNSPECHVDIDSKCQKLRFPVFTTQNSDLGMWIFPQRAQHNRKNTPVCAKAWFVPSPSHSSSASCSSPQIKCSAEEWSKRGCASDRTGRNPTPPKILDGFCYLIAHDDTFTASQDANMSPHDCKYKWEAKEGHFNGWVLKKTKQKKTWR